MPDISAALAALETLRQFIVPSAPVPVLTAPVAVPAPAPAPAPVPALPVVAPPVALAVGQPTPYLTSDDGIGGPWGFGMVQNLHLDWPSRTPWIDSLGAKGGLAPFATHTFSVGERFAFPVATLVRKLENRGFCLRPVPGQFSMNLAGRLATDAPTRPVLFVVTTVGEFSAPCDYFARYYPDPNQSMVISDCREVVGVSDSALCIAHFDLSGITGTVTAAALGVSCVAIDSHPSAVLELYELDPPRIFEGNGGQAPVPGIAAAYPFDVGLAAHPDALFVGDFGVPTMWHKGVVGTTVVHDAVLQSNVMLGTLGVDQQWSADVQVFLDGVVIDGAAGGKPKLPAWDEMYLRFYVYLESDFFSSHDTDWKMPGLGAWHGLFVEYIAPQYPLGGYWDSGASSGRGAITPTFGGIVKNAAGGWVYDEGALRGGIGIPLDTPGHPYSPYMALHNAPYHRDMTAYDGGMFPWPDVVIGRGKWYCIEQYVKMNSIDLTQPKDAFGNYDWTAARRDGVMKAWVDGRLVADSGPLYAFRRNPALGLRGLDGNWFYGGRAASKTTQSYRWRDVVLAKSYIGPRNETASAPSASPPPSAPVPVPVPVPVPPPVVIPPPTAGTLSVQKTANTFADVSPGFGTGDIIDAYSGGAFNPYWGTNGCMVFHGGGHAAVDDNSVIILDYDDWTFKRLSSPSTGDFAIIKPYGEYADGKPGSCHTYDNLAILPPVAGGGTKGSLIRVQSMAIGHTESYNTDWSHTFDFATGVWTRWVGSAMVANAPGGCSAYDAKRNRFWYLGGLGYAPQMTVRYLDVATFAKGEVPMSAQTPQSGSDAPILRMDPVRDILILSTTRDDGNVRVMWSRPWLADGWHNSNVTLPNPAQAFTAPFDYVPDADKFTFLTHGDPTQAFDVIVPADPNQPWTVTARPFGATIPTAWVCGKRWSYAPSLKKFVWLASSTAPVYVYDPH